MAETRTDAERIKALEEKTACLAEIVGALAFGVYGTAAAECVWSNAGGAVLRWEFHPDDEPGHEGEVIGNYRIDVSTVDIRGVPSGA